MQPYWSSPLSINCRRWLRDPATRLDAAIKASEELLFAAQFVDTLDALTSEDEKNDARLQRLRESPLVSEILRRMDTDLAWSPVLATLASRADRLYNAARLAMLRRTTPQEITPKRVQLVEVNWLRVLALLFVVSLIVFGVYSLVDGPAGLSSDNTAFDGLLYTLKGVQERQVVPLWAGTR